MHVPFFLEGGIEIAYSMHEMAFFSSVSSSAFFRRLKLARVSVTVLSTSVSVVFSATPCQFYISGVSELSLSCIESCIK